MKIRPTALMLVSLVAFSANAAHAQTARLATFSADQREEVTLSRAELPDKNCVVQLRAGVWVSIDLVRKSGR